MIALVIRNESARAAATGLTLMDIGFQVICVESRAAADAVMRGTMVDTVVVDETVGGTDIDAFLQAVARRNPQVSSFVLTDKKGADADALFLRIPSVYALLPVDAPPGMLVRLMKAAVTYAEDNRGNVPVGVAGHPVHSPRLLDWAAAAPPQLNQPIGGGAMDDAGRGAFRHAKDQVIH